MRIQDLHKAFLQCKTVSTDTRKITKGSMFFALKGDNFNGNHFTKEAFEKGALFCVIDEKEYAINDQCLLVNDVLESLQQLANYHRNLFDIPVIGLTGSNGKTTTKELINSVLSKAYNTIATQGNLNNHIGVPLTLLRIKPETEIAIVEMGANHQKEIDFLCHIANPNYGYITNFGKAHLEGFGGVEGVIKGKSELYDYLIKNNHQIFLNADDPIQLKKLGSYIKKYGFSQENGQYFLIKFLGADPFVKIQFEDIEVQSQLIGSYNFSNIASAILIGKYFNVVPKDIKSAIENYIPTNNRSQIIEKGTAKIILDAYNANPTSMKAALENLNSLEGQKIVILGDMFELGDSSLEEHQAIADKAFSMHFKDAFLIGANFNNTKTPVKTFESFEDFKELFNTNILKNTTVLIKGSRGMALEKVLDLL